MKTSKLFLVNEEKVKEANYFELICLLSCNRLMDKNLMVILINSKKAFDKIKTFPNKFFSAVTEEIFLNSMCYCCCYYYFKIKMNLLLGSQFLLI